MQGHKDENCVASGPGAIRKETVIWCFKILLFCVQTESIN